MIKVKISKDFINEKRFTYIPKMYDEKKHMRINCVENENVYLSEEMNSILK